MKNWSLSEAQTHLLEIVEASSEEPQIIADGGEPVAALVDIALFNELMAYRQRPTLTELLAEWDEIQAVEPVELDPPERQDRPNPLLGSS
jgi:prevent-host-death family protein